MSITSLTVGIFRTGSIKPINDWIPLLNRGLIYRVLDKLCRYNNQIFSEEDCLLLPPCKVHPSYQRAAQGEKSYNHTYHCSIGDSFSFTFYKKLCGIDFGIFRHFSSTADQIGPVPQIYTPTFDTLASWVMNIATSPTFKFPTRIKLGFNQ